MRSSYRCSLPAALLAIVTLGSGAPARAQAPAMAPPGGAAAAIPQRPVPLVAPVPVRYERRQHLPLLITGAAVFGAVYLSTVLVTALFDACTVGKCNRQWPMYIPLAGPFIDIPNLGFGGAWTAPVVISGVAQLAGMTMLIVGASIRRSVPVRSPRAQLLPYFAPSGGGAAVLARF